MGLKVNLRSLAVLTAFTPTLLLYQNCAPAFEAASPTSSLSSGGGGTQPTLPVASPKRVLMATGQVGRRLFSCDDGLSWRGDQSDDLVLQCVNGVDCDHMASSGRGLAYGGGAFYANFGWGANGSLRKSVDGLNWTIIRTGGWGAGVGYKDGQLYHAWNGGAVSTDEQTWTAAGSLPGNLDHPFFREEDGKLFAISAAGGTFATSADGGLSWQGAAAPTWTRDLAAGNGRIIAVGTTDTAGGQPNRFQASLSSDGGATWSQVELGTGSYSAMVRIIFDGSQFKAFQAGAGGAPNRVFTSLDGVTWQTDVISIPGYGNYFNGAFGFDKTTGTFVMSA
ncbi:MAG: exo-alpha-sialidase, partial [Proteobacteria bacterium]